MELRKAEFDRAAVARGLQSHERSGPRREKGAVPGRGRALGEGQDAARLRRHPRALRGHRDREVRADRPEGHRGRQRAPVQDHRRGAAARPRLPARRGAPAAARGRPRRGRAGPVPRRATTGDVQFISPTVDPASGTFQVVVRVRREPARTVLRPGSGRQGALPVRPGASSRVPPQADARQSAPNVRPACVRRSTGSSSHDVKNMSFRLRLLLSNLDEHWEDPDFRRTVSDLLASTVERLEGIAGPVRRAGGRRPHQGRPLDVNGLLREIASTPVRAAAGPPARGPAGVPGARRRAADLGGPVLPGDALSSLIENAAEAAAPAGKVLVRSFAGGTARRPRTVVEIIDNGAGMTAEFLRDRLFEPFATTKPHGVGPRPRDGAPDRAVPPRLAPGAVAAGRRHSRAASRFRRSRRFRRERRGRRSRSAGSSSSKTIPFSSSS